MNLDERDIDDLRHGRIYPELINSIAHYFQNSNNMKKCISCDPRNENDALTCPQCDTSHVQTLESDSSQPDQKNIAMLETSDDTLELYKSQIDLLNGALRELAHAGLSHLLTSLHLMQTVMERENHSLLDLVQSNLLSVQKMYKMFIGVQELSRLQLGEILLSPKCYHLAQLIESITDCYKRQAERKGLNFVCIIETAVTEIAYLDEKRVWQIIATLLDNAVKFTHQGEVSFKIAYHADKFSLEVKDTGCGIDTTYQKIFTPFRQVGRQTWNTSDMGTGLPISKKLAAMMGGCIDFTSEKGKGSLFILKLPIKAVTCLPAKSSYRVLLMGFDEYRRRVITNLLFEYIVDVAMDIESARAKANNFRPILVIIDPERYIIDKVRDYPEMKGVRCILSPLGVQVGMEDLGFSEKLSRYIRWTYD